MITDADAAILRDWSENVKGSIEGRNKAIVQALEIGATVPEIVALTGLTRGRIYQIKAEAEKR